MVTSFSVIIEEFPRTISAQGYRETLCNSLRNNRPQADETMDRMTRPVGMSGGIFSQLPQDHSSFTFGLPNAALEGTRSVTEINEMMAGVSLGGTASVDAGGVGWVTCSNVF